MSKKIKEKSTPATYISNCLFLERSKKFNTRQKEVTYKKKRNYISGAQTQCKNDKLLFQHRPTTKYLKELRLAPKIKNKNVLCVHVGCHPDDLICVLVQDGRGPWALIRDRITKEKKSPQEKRLVYLEELELERERWRLRPGDLERERRRAGDRLLGERDLKEIFMMDVESKLPAAKHQTGLNGRHPWGTYLLLIRGGLLRHMGGGGGILRGGESLRGGGRTRWVRTAEAVISCPSIWPENSKNQTLWRKKERALRTKTATFQPLKCQQNHCGGSFCYSQYGIYCLFAQISRARGTVWHTEQKKQNETTQVEPPLSDRNRKWLLAPRSVLLPVRKVHQPRSKECSWVGGLPPSMYFRAFWASSGVSNST